MFRKILTVLFLLLAAYTQSNGQGCTTLGQTPQTAFPVCGTTAFQQNIVPQCFNNSVPAATCGSYPDTNPFWYRFTCYTSGTLGFTITPNNLNDDYDWELFDITGHDPIEVYTNGALFVVANWSGSYGITGTSASNNNIISCGSDPNAGVTTYSQMPTITQGHTYLLLVSHFTNTQSGYSLSFGGGTASITDPVKPVMVSAAADCSAKNIYISINKKVICESLASNGSDFILSPANARVISATGINCSTSFDMDSLTLTLDQALAPGDYSVIIRNGSDTNTLLDNCSNEIPENSSIPFTVLPLAPTPMDSLTPIQCQPDVLRLVFKKPMRCSSIAANGSDFVVNGTVPVTVIGASVDSCSNGLSSIINVKLSKPITNAGNFTLTLEKGTDGNTILDECTQETPAGSSLGFITKDVVSAAFNYSVKLGCVNDTLFYAHDGKNGVNQWNWIFDSNGSSNVQNSFFIFNDYGSKHIRLTVSNGVCTDSASVDILLDNELKAQFNLKPSAELCPEDAAMFIDTSIGKITSWHWTFGDGTTSNDEQPLPKLYAPAPTRDGKIFPVSLIVNNEMGCSDTARLNIKVLYTCYIAVPSGFTPNGDGLNDYLYPLNAYKADNLQFRVYNRWGQLVYQTKDWTKKWDGSINGYPQPAGTYVWILTYTHRDTGKQFSLKGTTVLIR